ncbi:uncharacterized protein LOC120211908 [Hibiscus syriacus]|uniref:uncharacterized protein LOC120211908 n=1 Tax=Hibiscus syriacus TaxID=106335 RepID=UPI0019232FD3|nr:uncharacterized protein LOC120211908 [Hibiscus syriacus]
MLTFVRRGKKAMASPDKELELKLMEAGNKLLEPVSSVDKLINLLDQVESFLSRVEQSPGQAMQNALSHSLKALIAEQLFRHPDDDVKVAVAACISEITRITAPEAPYPDDQMREVFKLIVSSFESLSDELNRSYIKRNSILETVARVRSCVVMLDLECDALIIEMFQHFLNAIRDYHADTVFTSMVTIMTLVLEESEDISMELLSTIIARVKRDNEEVLPIARRLASSVLENCASKLKPYLTQAVENSGIPFEDYSNVVASICQVAPNVVLQNDAATEKRVDVECKPAEAPLANAIQEDKEIPKESVLTEQVDHANEKSPTSVVSNGIAQTDENNILPDSNSVKKQEDECFADKSENVDKLTVAEPNGLEGEKVVISDSKLEQSTKEKQGKPHSKSPSVDGAVFKENKGQKDVQPSLTKATEDESNDVTSPVRSGTIHDKSHSNKAALPKKKDGLSKIITPSVDNASKKSSGAMSDSEEKTNKRPGKKVASAVSNKDSALADVDKTKKESGTASDSEEKTLKQVSKKLDTSSNNAYGSSKKMGDKKKRRKLVLPEKDKTKISTSIDDEEMVDSPKAVKPNKHDSHMDEIHKSNSKRKYTQSEEKGSDTLEYDENLVGLKVKVWWPLDHVFYDGVIESFDPIIKKHKVCYDDGDVEILNLKEEKWEVIKVEPKSNEEIAADHPSPDGSFEISQKEKAKAADQLVKKAKMDASPKRGGGASSGKSKGAAMKSGSKIKDGKVRGFNSDEKADNVTKAKDHTPKSGGRPVDVASKVGSKSKSKKEDGVVTPKSTKPKDGDNATKAKDHARKSGSRPVVVALEVSSKPKTEVSVVTPKSTKPKGDDKPKDGDNATKGKDHTRKSGSRPVVVALEVSSEPKTEEGVDRPKSTKPKADDKPKDGNNVIEANDHTPKSGSRPVDDASKVGSKSKTEDGVVTAKPTKPKDDNKPKRDNVTKAKDHTTNTVSGPVDVASKVGSKSKNEDSVDTPKSTKPEDEPNQDTTKTTKSKQDTPKVSTKVKESESMKENPTVPADAVETLKRKALISSVGPGTDSKPEKKQRKEVKATSTAES